MAMAKTIDGYDKCPWNAIASIKLYHITCSYFPAIEHEERRESREEGKNEGFLEIHCPRPNYARS